MRNDLRKMQFLQSCYTFSNTGDMASREKRREKKKKKFHNETQCLQADAVAKISQVWLMSAGPPRSSAGCFWAGRLFHCSVCERRSLFRFPSGVGRAAGANICKLHRGL